MNKIMSLWLLCPALAVAAEWPSLSFYGQIGSGLEVSQVSMGNEQISRTRVSDLNSHIGVRGSHPIGERTQVIWQFDEAVPVGDGRASMRDYFRRKKATGFGR